MQAAELTVAYVQPDLVWEDWETNIRHLETLIAPLNEQVDLLLLPEMFGTGFAIEPARVAQSMSGPVVQWLTETAARRQCHCMGSQVISEDGNYYNRLISVAPDGSVSHYDKRHLFSYAGEDEHYTPGSHRLLVTIRGWKICPLVCYDLRFPVWSRNDAGYDVLLYLANWPKPRVEAWKTLLRARAIENLCYVIGVNRIGEDALSNTYVGASSAYDMAGTLLHESAPVEELKVLRLKRAALDKFRTEYNFLADRDRFTIH
ncbi:MAG: nitrilase-related carbon-nitrogen hydrolase [Saprospiraceae bacterium]|nr:nitrilase-related carbon-nitrogen hydrolase [Saprospiraceae bacterium]